MVRRCDAMRYNGEIDTATETIHCIVVTELTEKIEIIFFSLLLHHKYFLNPRFKKGEKYVLIQKDHNILSMIKYL